MTSPPLFDRRLQRHFEAKAACRLNAAAEAVPDFLLHHAALEIASRLALIKRRFLRAADIGARHGVMARLLKAQVPELEIVSLASTAECAKAAPPPAVVADEEALPLAQGSLDLVTSVLALHLLNDVPGTLVQARRALKPDGFFIAAVLGGDTLIELRQAFMAAEAETAKGVSPRVFPTMDLRDGGALLQRAGFALPVSDTERVTVSYSSPMALMTELKAMGAGNTLVSRSRTLLRRDTLARACEIYQERYTEQTGRIVATFEILYLSGWAPHESQQQPLRPGSATHRLADALGTVEIPAGDKAD